MTQVARTRAEVHGEEQKFLRGGRAASPKRVAAATPGQINAALSLVTRYLGSDGRLFSQGLVEVYPDKVVINTDTDVRLENMISTSFPNKLDGTNALADESVDEGRLKDNSVSGRVLISAMVTEFQAMGSTLSDAQWEAMT